ncbi:MAG: FAD-dependent oxidoreductase [Microbacteriaceae bacterium]
MSPSTPTNNIRPSVADVRDKKRTQVLIVGAGINGIATFRDLALQGVDVTLIERGDFVSGASSASSHMIHGGIRYLENGEFRLVKESVTERNALLRTAPHYVKPLLTTVPIFSTFSGILSAPLRFLTHKQGKPQERGALLIKVGLMIYDTFSRDGGSVPRHRFRARKRSLRELPRLNPGIAYTASYYDASMHDPERLALDVLSDGLNAGPHARAINYVEAVGSDAGGVIVHDRESGEHFTITADVIVNTSGPWTDLTNGAFGLTTTFMGGTKGSHIVLDNPELLEAVNGREIFFENSDGRIVLIYPLKGRVMIGTTDIEADPSKPVSITDDEIGYFFELVGHVYPDITVDRSQIVYTFSGIRPLPHHDDEAPGFVSRDYRIEEGTLDGTPLLSLVGGKWTTFRALAEHISNEVLEHLGAPRRTSTEGVAIGGGKNYPTSDAARTVWVASHGDEVGHARAHQLLERYGTHAVSVIEHLVAAPDEPVALAPDYSRREIELLASDEHVVHLIDVVLRRTSLAFVGALSAALLTTLAEIIGGVLDWSSERRTAEIAATIRELHDAHGVELSGNEISDNEINEEVAQR